MMRESQTIKSWMREGADIAEVRLMRTVLIELIGVQLENPVSESIQLAIEGTNDVSRLQVWYKAALNANSIGELRKQMKLEP